MKKLIFFLLMIMSQSLVMADDIDLVKDGIAYKILSLNPAQLEVVAKEGGYNGDVVIPEIVEFESLEFTVVSIGERSFMSNPITSISLHSKIKSIQRNAFSNCSGLNKIKLPSGLESIKEYAFSGCIIDSLIIPGSVKDLSEYCFCFCKNLEYLEIEEGVTLIPKYAFEWCDKLKTIILSSTVSNIEAAAFRYSSPKAIICKRNTTPNITGHDWFSGGLGTHTTYNPFTYSDSDDRPISVLLVPKGAKESYYKLKTQDGKDAWPVETIEEYDGNLNISVIGTEIVKDNESFLIINSGGINHAQLISVPDSESSTLTIPKSVSFNGTDYVINSLKSTLFSQNKILRDVYVNNDSPSEIRENTFSNITYLMGILHVPKGTIDIYKETKGWNMFTNIIELRDKYNLSYVVDEKIYKNYELEEGSTITPEPAPAKEGYTFSGWSEIPETMPAHDVTVTGAFTINKYKLTYIVDGEEYKGYEVEYGAAITPEPAPTKDGYTFSNWSEIPATMPAHDVTVTGTFAINKYKLTYTVDGEEYRSFEIEYGASITPEPTPTKEGYTFSGWSKIPETMPAHDVIVTGSFTVNQYTITYIIDNEVYTTQTVDYGSTIIPPTIPEREGYDFAWADYPETMPANDITIYGTYTTGIEAIMAGEVNCQIFSLDGKPLNEPQKGVNIVRMSNGQVRKVVVK